MRAVIGWRDAIREGRVLLRDIIDLEAPTAGPRPAWRAAAEAEPERGRVRPQAEAGGGRARRAERGRGGARRRPRARKRTISTRTRCRCRRSRTSCATACSRPSTRSPRPTPGLRELQEERLPALQPNAPVDRRARPRYQQARSEVVELMQQISLNQSRVEALVQQLFDVNKHLQSLEGKLLRLATCRRRPRELPRHYMGHELDHDWIDRWRAQGDGWLGHSGLAPLRGHAARRHRRDRRGDRAADRRVPPHRRPGPAGRARGEPGQEGDGRGQPAPRDLDRQEVHQPRPAVPGPDPGGQHRPDEGRGQVRVPARLQVLDLRHLVDPPGDHALDRRSGAHDPHPGAHDRDDQQAGARLAPDAARVRPRADARGARPQAQHAARQGPQGPQDRQGADLASRRRSATRRIRTSATSSRTRTPSSRSRPRRSPTCARPRPACWRR